MLAQRSFEDLGTPLAGVTFCVLDIETTGGSPADSAITEIGALKVRCGEPQGRFHSLVDPGVPVPAFIRLLTGIEDSMLVGAPRIEEVLPALIEFVGGSVVVAHNARFDLSFINAALGRAGCDPLRNRVVDTAGLARRILSGEVPNNKLATLTRSLRCAHQPTHRAFEDVLATTDLLHHLIERVAGFGVTTLEDLLAMSATRMDGTFTKITLADKAPKETGVYRFLDSSGRTLYVGKATDLRSRVRSYFYGDPRKRIRNLLRETQAIEYDVHASMLEAEVMEARAIARHKPPYNRAGKSPGIWYLKCSFGRTPRMAPARSPKNDRALYLGPYRSRRVVHTLIDALRDTSVLHRCADPSRCTGCAFAEMDRCAGGGQEGIAELRRVIGALVGDPGPVLEAAARRLSVLAEQERFEEAAEARDRAALLERSLLRAATVRALLDAGEIALRMGSRAILIRQGQLAACLDAAGEIDTVERLRAAAVSEPVGRFLPAPIQMEATVIASWLRRNASKVELLYVEGSFAQPAGVRPGRFEPAKAPLSS